MAVMRFNQTPQYKALMLDIDGTLIGNGAQEQISDKVRKTISKSHSKISVGIISGRPLPKAKFVIDQLSLTTPCIVSGGAQMIDPVSHEILWEQTILPSDLAKILTIARDLPKPNQIIVEDGIREHVFPHEMDFKKALGVYFPAMPYEAYKHITDGLKDISTIAVTECVSFTDNLYALHITHANATKKDGILKIAETLNIQPHEIIGVGDGYNDFPLFNACGLKVAVGNAVDELKARADYIAPSVHDDGVAHVVEKFILRSGRMNIQSLPIFSPFGHLFENLPKRFTFWS